MSYDHDEENQKNDCGDESGIDREFVVHG